jgi:thioredoxin reductase (NADPH)
VAEIVIYGASWCPDCRRAKKFLSDQRIAFAWHDIETHPDLVAEVQRRNDGRRIIPTIVFPDGSHLSEPTNEALARKLGIRREALKHAYDLVVIGGGPAGLTAAIYAARESLETLVIDSKGLGGQAGVTERLDNYPGFPDGIGGAELADRFVRQAERYGVEMLPALSVTGITHEGRHGLEVNTATGAHYDARSALIATGSTYRRTDVPGERKLIGAGIHFCATCDGPFYRGSDQLLVIGGGNSGLEEGLFLTQFADRVTVLERGNELRGSRVLQDKVTDHPKMEVLLHHEVKEFRRRDDGSGRLGAVLVRDRESGAIAELHPAAVFVFVGLDPNTSFLRDAVPLDAAGFVLTQPGSSMTAAPGLFAAGDVRHGSTKQLASAVGEGAAAAIAIRGYLDQLDAREDEEEPV